jgi:hypothetical protein
MTVLLPFLASLGVAFPALCVWLLVRIVKRRERWAQWTLGAVVALPLLYVLSIGPSAWLTTRHLMPQSLGRATKHLYDPIEFLMARVPKPVEQALRWYVRLWYSSAPPPDTPAAPRCARQRTHPAATGGSGSTTEIGSDFVIGPTDA